MIKTRIGKAVSSFLVAVMLSCMLPMTAAAAGTAFSFETPVSTALPVKPSGLISGDFNNDGKKDLISYTQDGEAKYIVMLGNNSGSFTSTTYTVGGGSFMESITGIASGDFNSDGKPDFVCSQGINGAYQISVYNGKGDGTFDYQNSYEVPHPEQIIVSDFNHDNIPDIAVGNTAPTPAAAVYVLLGNGASGNGDGTFQAPIPFVVGHSANNLACGDFNDDGWNDLAFSCDGVVMYILYNNKAGSGVSFNVSSDFSPSYSILGLASGDLNDDEKCDLIYSDGNYKMHVLLSNGAEPFSESSLQLATSYHKMSIADLNNDGVCEVVAAVNAISYFKTFEVGADGTITEGQTTNLENSIYPDDALLCDDFDGDGVKDVVVSHYIPSDILYFRNTTQDRISTVTLDKNESEAGTAAAIQTTVATKNIADGTTISASFLKANGTELAQPISASSTIASNSATLNLTIPADIPRGSYLIKTMVVTGGQTYTYESSYTIYSYGTIVWDNSSVQVNEDAGTVTIAFRRINGDKEDADLSYTLGGTAVRNTDYTTGGWGAASGLILMNGYEDSPYDLVFNIPDDNLENGNRTITITLAKRAGSAPVSGLPATATITILDDDGIVLSAPTINSVNYTTVNASVGGTFQVTAAGTTPITYSLSGQPAGVSISATSGLMTMSNLVDYTKNNSVFTITASNGTQPDATQSFTLRVRNTPVLHAPGLADGTIGEQYSMTIPVTGAEPMSWSKSGSLPAGLTLSNDGTISGIPTTVGSSTFSITATNSLGSYTDQYTLTIKAVADNTGSGGGGGGGVTQSPATPGIKGSQDGNGNASIEITSTASKDAKIAEVSITKENIAALEGKKATVMTVKTPVATIAFDDKAFETIAKEAAKDIKITTSKVSADSLSDEAKSLVGDHPVYNFAVTSGDKTISQFGGNVQVSVPYTPKAGEDPKAIVIYYINAQGKPEPVKDCVYDEKTGMITFTTNHFSQYAVGYHAVDFGDVKENAWYADAVTFLAARGITTGTTDGNFNPNGTLTRAQFLVMTMRAYGISPSENTTDNFTDAGNTYYTEYLAEAKKLGMADGIGNNLFAPEKAITRQEMCTLLYNTLKQIGKLPSGDTGTELTAYTDTDQMASWAADAVTLFVESGTITGNNGKLQLKETTTRAQMTQVLYNLLSK